MFRCACRRFIVPVVFAALCFGPAGRAEDPSETKPKTDQASTVERIRQALNNRVDYVLDEQTLEEFTEFLRATYHIPVVIDEAPIRDGINDTKLPNVSKCDMRGVRLRTMLGTILGDQGLDWLIHDDVLWITTRDVASDMLESRVYDVKDLVEVDGVYEFDPLIDLIMNTIAPDKWTATGGPGSLERFRVGETAALVIRTTAHIHEQIEELLASLRTLKKTETKSTSQIPYSPQPVSTLALEADPKRDVVVAANNEFALDLYGQLRQKKGNLIVSPFNISSALAMAYAGARNETAHEMAATMHWPLPEAGLPGDDLHAGFLSLQNSLQGLDLSKGYELKSANRVWCRQGLTLEAPFLLTTRENYRAEAALLDFTNPGAVRTINSWIAQQTGGQIKDMLKQLSPNAALALTSAIYFHGKWAIPFESKDTRPKRFNLGNTLIDAFFMEQKDRHGYAEIDGFQILAKPYKGNALSMVVLLPPEQAGALETLESSVSAEKLQQWLTKLQTRRVHLLLPKFKFETETDLNGTLMQLGMRQAFSRQSADFTGIARIDSEYPLYLDKVLHKATIDVAEEGTKATAATMIVGAAIGGIHNVPKLPVFFANRPFVFLIRDLRTGSILFMGRLAEPEGLPMNGFQPPTRILDQVN